MRKSLFFSLMKIFIVLCGTMICMVMALVFAAKIPQDAIRKKTVESAEYLCEGELFGNVLESVRGSKIDRYADAILLGIAYQYDAEHPLESVMRSAYYESTVQDEGQNLYDAVTQGLPANQQYLRYWHGSISVVRPLLIWMSVKDIYRWNGIWMTVLLGILLALLFHRRAYAPVVGIVAGFVLTMSWFVPFSLEYTWTYLLMLLFAILTLETVWHGRDAWYSRIFLIFGILTNYFDFLTTETLTLTVPLLLLLRENGKAVEKDGGILSPDKRAWGITLRAVVSWGCGYVGAWVFKWILASYVLGENVMPYVSEHIAERIGVSNGLFIGEEISPLSALLNNVKCLLPWSLGTAGIVAGWGIGIGCLYMAFVYRGKNCNWKTILLYGMIGLIPYVRYMVMQNHSFVHDFFTYRAQMGMILAVVLILEELCIWETLCGRIGHAGKKK